MLIYKIDPQPLSLDFQIKIVLNSMCKPLHVQDVQIGEGQVWYDWFHISMLSPNNWVSVCSQGFLFFKSTWLINKTHVLRKPMWLNIYVLAFLSFKLFVFNIFRLF